MLVGETEQDFFPMRFLSHRRSLSVSRTYATTMSSINQHIQSALSANRTHQYALTTHAQRLTAELQEIDKLLVRAALEQTYARLTVYMPVRMKPHLLTATVTMKSSSTIPLDQLPLWF